MEHKKETLKYIMLLLKGEQPLDTALCKYFKDKVSYIVRDHFRLIMSPTFVDYMKLGKAGFDTKFWGSDSASNALGELTPLRQTLIILYANYIRTDENDRRH